MPRYTPPQLIATIDPGTDRLRHPDDGAVCRMLVKTVSPEALCRGELDNCSETSEGCGRKRINVVFADTLAFPNPNVGLWIPDQGLIAFVDDKVDDITGTTAAIHAVKPSTGPHNAPRWVGSASNGRSVVLSGPDKALSADDGRLVLSPANWTMFGVVEPDRALIGESMCGLIATGDGSGYGVCQTDDLSFALLFKSGGAMYGADYDGLFTFVVTMADGLPKLYIDGVLQELSGSRPELETQDSNELHLGCLDAPGRVYTNGGYPGTWYELGVHTSPWNATQVGNWNAYAQQKYVNNETRPRASMECCPTRLIQREYDLVGSDEPLVPPPVDPPE